MVEGTALEMRQIGIPGAWVQIPPSPFFWKTLVNAKKSFIYKGFRHAWPGFLAGIFFARLTFSRSMTLRYTVFITLSDDQPPRCRM